MNTCLRCGRRTVLGWHRCDAQLQPIRVPAARPPIGRAPIGRPAPQQPIPHRNPPPLQPGRGGIGRPPGPLPGYGLPSPHERGGLTSTGVVATRPSTIGGGGALDAALAPITLLLIGVTILVTPALFTMAVMLLLVFLVIGWFLGRIGMLWPLMFLRARGGGRAAPSRPSLAFRCDTGGRIDEVRLFGHEIGVALGDSVRVSGLRFGGVLHATSVANGTTGVVLRRRGAFRLGALILIDLWLLLSIVSILGVSS